MKKPSEKSVRVAALKARLSEYIRAARRGHPVVVYDRDTPVARLAPTSPVAKPLAIRKPLHDLHDVALPSPLERPVDSLAALLEERLTSR